MTQYEFGDIVNCTLPGGGEGLVVGVMHYAKKGDVVLMANEKYVGMPVNIQHLVKMPGSMPATACMWRKRYLDKFGDHWLAPLPDQKVK
jgi:hypothetical protein